MIRAAIANWLPLIIIMVTVLLFMGMVMGGLVYEETHKYTPPRCQEDQTIGYDGQCLTVDDSDFRGGYWYPKE